MIQIVEHRRASTGLGTRDRRWGDEDREEELSRATRHAGRGRGRWPALLPRRVLEAIATARRRRARISSVAVGAVVVVPAVAVAIPFAWLPAETITYLLVHYLCKSIAIILKCLKYW